MTQQEIFDKVWEHFIVNKGNPSHDGMVCKYKDHFGNKCAVGLFIPNNKYSRHMEGVTSAVIQRDFNILKEVDPVFLGNIQGCHDCLIRKSPSVFTKEMEVELRKLAHNYSLTIPGERKDAC